MANETQVGKPGSGYVALLRNHGFQSFLWTQFLGAFNDNVYKMIVSVGAVELVADRVLGARYLALAGGVFVGRYGSVACAQRQPASWRFVSARHAGQYVQPGEIWNPPGNLERGA